MRKRLRSRLRILATIAGAMVFCSPLWSDVRIPSGASSAKRICYCDCDNKSGAPMCMHMCELPKYENRSWASSCHKNQDSEITEPSGEASPHSSKDNHVQQARR